MLDEEPFSDAVRRLRHESRYRNFADIARRCGAFPTADQRAPAPDTPVTVWCSNDYVGMG